MKAALCVALLCACTPALRVPQSGPAAVLPDRELAARFPANGAGAASVVFDGYTLDLTLEPSPASADLYALLFIREHVLAFGDEGIMLRRDAGASPWLQLPSPTRAGLRAAAKRGESHGDEVFVVGERGTWLTSRGEGDWTLENAQVEADLLAVASDGDRAYAVGEAGVLVVRYPDGAFARVASRTQARLRDVFYVEQYAQTNHGEALRHLVLVGDGGTIVDCSLRVDPPLCIPRASPTSDDLIQIEDVSGAPATFHALHSRAVSTLIVGVSGATLGVSMGRLPPFDFVPAALELHPGDGRLLVSWRGSRGGKVWIGERRVRPPMVWVGPQGAGVFLDGNARTAFSIPGQPKLRDLAADDLTLFAVGDGGTIVHAAIRGARMLVKQELLD